MWALNCKKPYLEWWSFVQGWAILSTPILSCMSTTCCQVIGPHLTPHFAWSIPLITHVTNWKTTLAHWNSSWSDNTPLSMLSFYVRSRCSCLQKYSGPPLLLLHSYPRLALLGSIRNILCQPINSQLLLGLIHVALQCSSVQDLCTHPRPKRPCQSIEGVRLPAGTMFPRKLQTPTLHTINIL